MTNILAQLIVTLITNRVEQFPQHFELTSCPQGIVGCAVAHGNMVNDLNPTHKTIVISCVERTNISFHGVSFVFGEHILWSTNWMETLESKWVPKS